MEEREKNKTNNDKRERKKIKKGRKYPQIKTNCNSSFETQAFCFLINSLDSTFDLAGEYIDALHI